MNKVMQKFKNNSISMRMLSTIALVPIALMIFTIGGNLFAISFIAIGILMAFEWANMVGTDNKKWSFIGLFYILLPIISIIYLRNHDNGLNLIIYMFAIIWSTDIAAYLFGIAIGGPKLLPSVSPSKSWAGCIGGLMSALLVSLFLFKLNLIANQNFIPLSLVMSLIAQSGDLLESYFKRLFKIKDSGNLIPGHGGVLDRMDSVITSAPILALIIKTGLL